MCFLADPSPEIPDDPNFFVINAAALSDAGIYDVVATSATCTQTSDPAPLVVQQCP